MQVNTNKMLNFLKKKLDIEQFEDYNESIFESRMEDISHVIGFVKEIREYVEKKEMLEEKIKSTYKATDVYLKYLNKYEDSVNVGEYEYHEQLYKYGISDAIKIIGEKVKSNSLKNLLLHNVSQEKLDNILNQRVQYIVQKILDKEEKFKSLEWEKAVDNNIKNEKIIVEYKKILNDEITINRQSAYKYGLYDAIYIYNFSTEQ